MKLFLLGLSLLMGPVLAVPTPETTQNPKFIKFKWFSKDSPLVPTNMRQSGPPDKLREDGSIAPNIWIPSRGYNHWVHDEKSFGKAIPYPTLQPRSFGDRQKKQRGKQREDRLELVVDADGNVKKIKGKGADVVEAEAGISQMKCRSSSGKATYKKTKHPDGGFSHSCKIES